tara:strand:- start:43189 stop:43440 length:252 start_codon:yes stop_codon:yes gene_type:complete
VRPFCHPGYATTQPLASSGIARQAGIRRTIAKAKAAAGKTPHFFRGAKVQKAELPHPLKIDQRPGSNFVGSRSLARFFVTHNA